VAGKVIYLTPEGKKKLEEELEHLSTVGRMEVALRLREATEEGDDLEESAAFEVAKNEQAFLEGRIKDIEGVLARAWLVEPGEFSGRIRIGSQVVVQEDGGERETYKIVGTAESDPRGGLISYESPLAQALLERGAGEEVVVNAPVGSLRFRIIDVL
jgi:transcription elongation factor GreA